MTISYLPNLTETPEGCVTYSEIVAAAQISYRQLDHWTRTGLLLTIPRPEYAGSGWPRYYPRTELTVACLMADLTRAGLLASVAHDRARELATTGTTRIAGIPVHLPEEL